jgi:hypothetical protein
VGVVGQDAGRAVGGGLVAGDAERGEHPADRHGREIGAGGLHDHAGGEDSEAGRQQPPPVPGPGQRSDDR